MEAPLGVSASGGPGNDVLIGNAGADSLWGGGEWTLDIATAEELEDRLGKDTLLGGDGPDLLVAGAGDDRIEAGDGADLMAGGDGNDLVDGGPGGDAIASPDAGDDRLLGGPGDDQPEAADVISGCEALFEEWPRNLPLCRVCTFAIEAKIGSRFAFLARLPTTLSEAKPWAVIPLGQPVRALLQSRGTLRLRLRFQSGNGPVYAPEWFVLKR